MGSIDFGTRHTKQIAGTRKSIENSNLIIIIGAIVLVIGLFILGYTYKKYHNWDEVQASYKEYRGAFTCIGIIALAAGIAKKFHS